MIQLVSPVLTVFLQISLFALIAPAVVGLQRWIKARLQLRKGPPPWQPYLDLIKLLRIPVKRQPETTSWVYTIAPFATFVCYALLGWTISPFINPGFPTLDLVTLVYLLGLARFILALAGMDTGTPFGGLGSSREMFINVLAEPLLVLIILALTLTLTVQPHTTDTATIITHISILQPSNNLVFNIAALLLLWLALAFVALMDNGLLPVDNPSTHLELTMIQKALHLEYSGRNLALIEWGEAMRLTFFLALLGDLLVPAIPMSMFGSVLYLVKLLAAIVLLALFEVTRVKLRLRRVIIPWVLAIGATFLAIVFTVAIH